METLIFIIYLLAAGFVGFSARPFIINLVDRLKGSDFPKITE